MGSTVRRIQLCSNTPIGFRDASCVRFESSPRLCITKRLETIKNCQRSDAQYEIIRECIEIKGTYKDYTMRRDILYRVVEGIYLLVVPKNMQTQVIRAVHECGHISAKRTEREVNK